MHMPTFGHRACVVTLLALAMVVAVPISAQTPDSTRADSARVADSLALVRELEKGAAPPPAPAPTARQGTGPTNPRMLPDLSVVGDLLFDLSKKGSTQPDGSRLGVREVEVALQSVVDPYFRGDVYFGFNDVDGVSIEQAFLTATSLPWNLEARLGRFFVPFGKQGTTHRHDLHTFEYPWVIQRFLAPEGLKGTGGSLSKIFSPFGFYQELIVTVLDRFGEPAEGLTPDQPSNQSLSGLGYTARFRNYWDLTPNTNIELSASAGTGKLPQPITAVAEFDAVNARQSLVGVDFTYRWRPLQQGLYRSFILQTEYFRQINEKNPDLPGGITMDEYAGPRRDFAGAYLFSRYQTGRRTFLAARGDWLEDPAAGGQALTAASGYLEFFPSEFSKLLAGYERVWQEGSPGYGRLILQATFALGPHRPHPF